jgi:hypothetical protein
MTRERHKRPPFLVNAAALAVWLAGGLQPATGQTEAAAQAIQLGDHGAACDWVTDDSPALSRALADARERRLPVLIPARRCAFGDVIRVDGVTLKGTGEGSVLHALDWRRSAIFMSGASPVVADLKLTAAAAPSRQAPWEMTRIAVIGATDFVIERVVIDGAAAAGIQTAQAATRGRITNNVVRNTLSDGIHLGDGASHLLVEGNLVEGTGDDGIAIVSYRDDEVRVHHVVARNNVVRNNRDGRNMSVVGGEHVVYENNLLQNNLAGRACLYIAQEGGKAPTKAARDVVASHNTVEHCGGVVTSHGAVMLFSAGQEPNAHIRLLDNDVRSPGRTGIRVLGPHVDVQLQSNRITDALQPLDIPDPLVQVVPYSGGPVGRTGR